MPEQMNCEHANTRATTFERPSAVSAPPRAEDALLRWDDDGGVTSSGLYRNDDGGIPRESGRKQSAGPDSGQLESFARALDQLHGEVKSKLGAEDVTHIRRIRKLSTTLEVAGRGLIHFSFEPLGFGLGVTALWGHKSLELMEIGHMTLHRCYDRIDGAAAYRSDRFRWKAPIDEQHWQRVHNLRHHVHTNIEGRDTDLSFGMLRLSPRVPYRRIHALQPVTNVLTWFNFANAINLHVTGMLDRALPEGAARSLPDDKPETVRAGKRAFLRKFVRYHGREYVFFPALAGPLFWKTLLGNALSEVGRDLYAGAAVYCGHVGAKDYPRGTRARGRARWYRMQAEAARNIRVPRPLSVLCGGLDRQIEHHLFPHLPPNRLRAISPRVKAICEQHGVRYLEKSWPATLRQVLAHLREMASPQAAAGPA